MQLSQEIFVSISESAKSLIFQNYYVFMFFLTHLQSMFQFYTPWKHHWFLKGVQKWNIGWKLVNIFEKMKVCDFYYVLNRNEIETVMSLRIWIHIFEFSSCANVYVFLSFDFRLTLFRMRREGAKRPHLAVFPLQPRQT